MKHGEWVQRIRLITLLSVTGALGGLMTPLPSEALTPTLTVKVDGGTATSIVITTNSTCNPTEVTLGFTHCYALNTSATVAGSGAPVNRSYNVRNAPNATARLRLADKAGQDAFSISGVQFIPALANWGSASANTNEQHVLTITMGAKFDSTTNTNNGGTYAWGIRAGGELRAGPSPVTAPTACAGFTTTGACNTVGDVINFPGKGTFSPTLQNVSIVNPAGATANTVPLRLAIAGPTSSPVSFDGKTEQTLGQVSPSYPKFTCDADGVNTGVNVCKPTITQTMTVTLKGPDTLVLVNGGDGMGANCAVGIGAEQQRQLDHLAKLVKFLQWLEKQRPDNQKLSAFIDKLEAFLATATRTNDPECPGASVVDLFFAIEGAQDQIAFFTDGAVPVEPAPLHYYAVINAPGLTWEQARDAAKGIRTDCDLATITSPGEQAIINGLLPDPSGVEGTQDYWIGGRQPGEAAEPGGNWQWINEEGMFWNNGPVIDMFANWGSTSTGPANEPNNLGGSENHLTIDNRYGWGWNDLNTSGENGTTKGYITEGTTGVCVPPVID